MVVRTESLCGGDVSFAGRLSTLPQTHITVSTSIGLPVLSEATHMATDWSEFQGEKLSTAFTAAEEFIDDSMAVKRATPGMISGKTVLVAR